MNWQNRRSLCSHNRTTFNSIGKICDSFRLGVQCWHSPELAQIECLGRLWETLCPTSWCHPFVSPCSHHPPVEVGHPIDQWNLSINHPKHRVIINDRVKVIFEPTYGKKIQTFIKILHVSARSYSTTQSTLFFRCGCELPLESYWLELGESSVLSTLGTTPQRWRPPADQKHGSKKHSTIRTNGPPIIRWLVLEQWELAIMWKTQTKRPEWPGLECRILSHELQS